MQWQVDVSLGHAVSRFKRLFWVSCCTLFFVLLWYTKTYISMLFFLSLSLLAWFIHFFPLTMLYFSNFSLPFLSEKIALYNVFIGHYSYWLIIPSIIGVAFQVCIIIFFMCSVLYFVLCLMFQFKHLPYDLLYLNHFTF